MLIEVALPVAVQEAWAHLREPALIRRWFGWDYEGADEEIEQIFFTEATVDDAGRMITFGAGDRLAVDEDGERSVVRLIRAAPAGQASWDGIYDEINEGWLTFMQQLRFMLERHPNQDRTALHIPLTGEPWFESANQTGVVTDQGLVIRTPLRVIVSRYG
jgi:hypothetical protein